LIAAACKQEASKSGRQPVFQKPAAFLFKDQEGDGRAVFGTRPAFWPFVRRRRFVRQALPWRPVVRRRSFLPVIRKFLSLLSLA